jgi:hypothetical protein
MFFLSSKSHGKFIDHHHKWPFPGMFHKAANGRMGGPCFFFLRQVYRTCWAMFETVGFSLDFAVPFSEEPQHSQATSLDHYVAGPLRRCASWHVGRLDAGRRWEIPK